MYYRTSKANPDCRGFRILERQVTVGFPYADAASEEASVIFESRKPHPFSFYENRGFLTSFCKMVRGASQENFSISKDFPFRGLTLHQGRFRTHEGF